MKKKVVSLLVAGCLVGTMAVPGTVMAESNDLSGTKITAPPCLWQISSWHASC